MSHPSFLVIFLSNAAIFRQYSQSNADFLHTDMHSWSGIALPTFPHCTWKIWTTPFLMADYIDKMDATGNHNQSVICYVLALLREEPPTVHVSMWNNQIKTDNVLQWEDTRCSWLARNSTHAFVWFHSGSAVFTWSALWVTEQLEAYTVCQCQTHLVCAPLFPTTFSLLFISGQDFNTKEGVKNKLGMMFGVQDV